MALCKSIIRRKKGKEEIDMGKISKGRLSTIGVGALMLAIAILCTAPARADEAPTIKLSDTLNNLQFGMLAYIDYSVGQSPLANNQSANFNRFALTRGYLTVQKGITPWLAVRMTSDVYQDTTTSSGNSTNGKYLFRLKYLYAEFSGPDLGPITQIKGEVGMGHIPWLDFEEGLNPYRCLGTMPIERAGIFASADLGASIMANIGGKLDDAKKRTGSDKYSGKYGSWHIGVYNGGGYSAIENNQDKVVEGRITLRPLPGFLPGLQLSYFALYGRGNTQITKVGIDNEGKWPLYQAQLGMLSFTHPRFIVSGQYFAGWGNSAGTAVTATNVDSLQFEGYSFFGNIKLPILKDRLALFTRYDYFNPDTGRQISVNNDASYWFMDSGVAFDFYKGNMLVINYRTTHHSHDSGGVAKMPKENNNLGTDQFVQAVLQIKF